MTAQAQSIQHQVSNGQTRAIANIAMVMVLVTFSMLFATLFMGYVALRTTAPVWPPMGMNDLPLLWPIISTVVIVLSSFTWMKFERTQKFSWMGTTFVLGLIFSVSQFLLWNSLKHQGILADTGVYASIIYSFTWIHAAHIGLALILLLWPLVWSYKNTITDTRVVKIESIGKFWHFLGIVWILMFISLFLI